ncbi:selenoprotein [Halobacteriales archaeon QS_8_69_73]|nr:MAG: selenoprotein [Halobacteriales archaeon QS_8_69_73]
MPRRPLPAGTSDVEIASCVPCGFLNRAVGLAETLLSTSAPNVDSVSLVTGDHGVFEVCIDGAVVLDNAEDEAGETAAIRNRIFSIAHRT